MATSLDTLMHASRDTVFTSRETHDPIPIDHYHLDTTHQTLYCQTETPSSRSPTRHYTSTIIFLHVMTHPASSTSATVEVPLNDTISVRIKSMTAKSCRVQVQCTCEDFQFTWAAANHQVGSLVGPPPPTIARKSGRPPRNPRHVPGLCKHLRAMIPSLYTEGILQGST